MATCKRGVFLLCLIFSSCRLAIYDPLQFFKPAYPYRDLRLATVVRVVDGDTVKIQQDEVVETVRLIGVNTPETKAPGKPVECYGPEASAWLTTLLPLFTVIALETDTSQGDTDKYGRKLYYLWIKDRLINAELIRLGYGKEYTYATPYKYQTAFRQLQAETKRTKAGLWGNCAK